MTPLSLAPAGLSIDWALLSIGFEHLKPALRTRIPRPVKFRNEDLEIGAAKHETLGGS
jgi:hypothetical protein